jgi:hypothetical protein
VNSVEQGGEQRTCVECREPFVFAAAERRFFAQSGLTWPTRCRPCRAARRPLTAYSDEPCSCASCGQAFVFTAGQQRFFAERRLSPLTRCSACRGKRNRKRRAEIAAGAPV